jgi:ligand-binding sensor domain-containing protein
VDGGVFVHSTHEKSRQEGHKESKMMKYLPIYTLLSLFVFCTPATGQNKTEPPKNKIPSHSNEAITAYGPKNITRTIIQDRSGNIWLAAFDGIFRYDGKSFTNVTSKVSSARFFSVLQDRKGNLWFGSIGSGVYHYDGTSFRHFTTKEGLVNNEIDFIYQDQTGDIWFGANGGVSRYDGKVFRNYMMNGDSMAEDRTGKTFPDFTRPPNGVTAVIEDKKRNFWFCTTGHTFVYDGKVFTVVIHDGKPFTNVRTIIEDKKGNIWLGGNDGLWRYDGNTFANVTPNFVGYIYEDKNGNIWTSSTRDIGEQWVLSRYDEKSLNNAQPTVTEIKSAYENNRGMMFGIVESNDGKIWFGGLDGVYRYDGNTVSGFKDKAAQQ